jgi:hypothetical protein
MAKIQTGEFSSYSNNLIDELSKSKVWLWDCGPEEPIIPEEPEPPAVPIADPKYHLENLRHKRAVKRFEDELLIYERNEAEFQNWHRNIRGPVELLMWSCDARDAMEHDARAVKDGRQKKQRYYVSSRTRGYERTKNLGLPNDVQPGVGHRENMERQLAGEKEFIEILKADPQFGQENRP